MVSTGNLYLEGLVALAIFLLLNLMSMKLKELCAVLQLFEIFDNFWNHFPDQYVVLMLKGMRK